MPSLTDPTDAGTDAALTALLEWHVAMGADAMLADAPIDRFAESADEIAQGEPASGRISPKPASPSAARIASQAPGERIAATAQLPGGDAVMKAREAAGSARNLDELRDLLAGFDGCNLKLTAKNMVFGTGNPQARLMLVGEAPGRDEDLKGIPFIGRSGQLLDRMLSAIGSGRQTDSYITNVIYWRPPGNRDPSDFEVAVCRPFILRQIELIAPEILVFLGAQPAKALLGGDMVRSGIRKLRGHWCELEVAGRRIPALPTFHPAYLLRSPIEKRYAWRDFLAIRSRLAGGA